MPLIDDRARVFGRVNLIDALVLVMLLGLLPVAYAAYRLFRVPVPTIVAIQPTRVRSDAGEATLQITGTNLRPFLRAHIGDHESAGFLVQSPTKAEIKVPPGLPAGTYDVALFDEGRELLRVPSALTVAGLVEDVPVQAVGLFLGVPPDAASALRPGTELNPLMTLLARRAAQPAAARLNVGSAIIVAPGIEKKVQVPAILRMRCEMSGEQCHVGEAVLAQGSVISVPTPGGKRQFLVTNVRTNDAPTAFGVATVRVRFIVDPGTADVVRVGDRDVGRSAVAGPLRAAIAAVDADRPRVTVVNTFRSLDGRGFQMPDSMVALTATVTVPVVNSEVGWLYNNRPVKMGEPFVFETRQGVMEGALLSVRVDGSEASSN